MNAPGHVGRERTPNGEGRADGTIDNGALIGLAGVVLMFSAAGCSSSGGTPSGPTTVSSRLTSTDNSYVLQDNSTRFARGYTFTVTSTGPAFVTLTSADFVPLLTVLIGPAAQINVDTVPPAFQLYPNANGSVETGTFNAVSGDGYVAVVSSVDPVGTGAFTLGFSQNLGNVQLASLPPITSGQTRRR